MRKPTCYANSFYFTADITKSTRGSGKDFFVEGYAATTDMDRQHDVIAIEALKEAAPRLLANGTTAFFNHDYNRCVGRLDAVNVDEKGLWVKIYVSEWEEELRKKIEEGIIKKFSIGGRLTAGERLSPSEAVRRLGLKEKPAEPINIISSMDLFEVSIVGLPANASAEFVHKSLYQALKDANVEKSEEVVAIRVISKEEFKDAGQIPDNVSGDNTALPKDVSKGVIPYAAETKADENTAWDGPAERKAADVEKLKKMAAWYDESKPDVKGSYKEIHHRASDIAVVWMGVRTAMANIFGARSKPNIPAGDIKGIYNHLAKHYAQFGKTAPEYKDYAPEELKQLFPEDITWEVTEDNVEIKSEETIVKEACTTPDCQDPTCPEHGKKPQEEVVDIEDACKKPKVEKEEVTGPACSCGSQSQPSADCPVHGKPVDPEQIEDACKKPKVQKEEVVPAAEEITKDVPAVEAEAPAVPEQEAHTRTLAVKEETVIVATDKGVEVTTTTVRQEEQVHTSEARVETETVASVEVRTYTEEYVKQLQADYQKQLNEKEAEITSLKENLTSITKKLDGVVAPVVTNKEESPKDPIVKTVSPEEPAPKVTPMSDAGAMEVVSKQIVINPELKFLKFMKTGTF